MPGTRRYIDVRLGITASLILLLSSCALLGPESDLERFAHGDREDWQQVALHSDFDLRPAADDVTLVGVHVREDYDGNIIVDDFVIQGPCDEECRRWTSDIEALASDPGIVPTVIDWRCGNCDLIDALIVVEVSSDGVRSVSRGELPELLVPIDTAYEALLVFGTLDRLRRADSGWEIIRRQYPDCTPADIEFELWSLAADGQRAEVDTYVLEADSSEPETCA